MKNLILLLLLFTMPSMMSSQTKEQKLKFTEYQEQELFKVEDTDIVVSRIMEGLAGDKNALYLKVKSFLSKYYANPAEILEIDDKEGGLLLGKAYTSLASWGMLFSTKFLGADYTLKIDVKDGRVRVKSTTSQWIYQIDDNSPSYYNILMYAPFTKKGFTSKHAQTETFFRFVEDMQGLIDGLEASLRENNDEW